MLYRNLFKNDQNRIPFNKVYKREYSILANIMDESMVLRVLEKTLLGRTIIRIEPSRDYNNNFDGWAILTCNDGTIIRVQIGDSFLIAPAIDPNKLLTSMTWEGQMPDISSQLVNNVKGLNK